MTEVRWLTHARKLTEVSEVTVVETVWLALLPLAAAVACVSLLLQTDGRTEVTEVRWLTHVREVTEVSEVTVVKML